jgi:hypothetical protein
MRWDVGQCERTSFYGITHSTISNSWRKVGLPLVEENEGESEIEEYNDEYDINRNNNDDESAASFTSQDALEFITWGINDDKIEIVDEEELIF